MNWVHALPNEQRLARLVGEEQLRALCEQTERFRHAIPLLGAPYSMYDGLVVPHVAGGAFSSLGDLVSEARDAGKLQQIVIEKEASVGDSTGAHVSYWRYPNQPAAAADPAAIPGGSVPDNTTTGSFGQRDAAGGDTLHLLAATLAANPGANALCLLLYDRLFHASGVTHSITTAQTVSGAPTRYATTTSPGNFAFLEVTTGLPSTAHNLTMTYTDQDGNSAEAAAAFAVGGSSGFNHDRVAHTPWFIPLNSPDTGIRTVTQLQFSAGPVSGVSNLVMGHPLALIPLGLAGELSTYDAVMSGFNLAQIVAGACLSLLLVYKGTSTAQTISGIIELGSG